MPKALTGKVGMACNPRYVVESSMGITIAILVRLNADCSRIRMHTAVATVVTTTVLFYTTVVTVAVTTADVTATPTLP